MVTRWKKWVSVIVLFLGFYLTLTGCVGTWYAVWGLVPRGLGPEVVYQSDYRDTAYFRREMTGYLYDVLNCLQSGRTYHLWTNADVSTNLLYSGSYRSGYNDIVYTNTDYDLSRGLPDGYSFLLAFRNGKVIITKDGETVDVYGNGYYTKDSQWDVPGYVNRDSSGLENYTVYLAVASQPVDHGWWEPIWDMKQVITYVRYGYLGLFGVWAGAVLCLTLAVVLRRARREARAAIAARTARVWFEVKALWTIFPAFLFWQLLIGGFFWGLSAFAAVTGLVFLLCYPVLLYLTGCDLRHNKQVWKNSLCARLLSGGKSAAGALSARQAAAARLASHIWFEWKLLLLVFLPFPALWTLSELRWAVNYVESFLFFLALFVLTAGLWLATFYVLVCDLRCNQKPWRHGLVAALLRGLGRLWRILRGAELSQPLRRRFLARMVVAAAGVLILAFLSLVTVFGYCWDHTGLSFFASILTALLAVLLLLLPLAWLLDRTWVLLRDLVPLTDQLSTLRSGGAAQPLTLPEGSDLSAAAGDLNRVQEGLRSAVAEQMKSERMKVELIANVSHDLKTPLTSVVSYAALLGEEEDLPPHVKDYIRILNEKARRLQVMVQDVFEVSKAASGELPLHMEQLDLTRLLDQTMADMDETIRRSGLTFRTTLPSNPVWIIADGDRLYRVFQNLIQNALRYSLEGSRVYVTLEVVEGRAVARLKNTSRDELPSGVDFTARFVRGDVSRTDGGSGLGLAIASSFTAACGGTLRVETDADLFTVEVTFPTSG
ncbi:sensor histidine kinase [Intestinimonas timonensis]|uniref:sensor histidine kinase n=1 Tax=Intestinimonas timonensis TaxID=1689270 RepID=UPI001031C436|nr:HAMP domain-containing sensor histidine kinase [Intestinimonas timonensis]